MKRAVNKNISFGWSEIELISLLCAVQPQGSFQNLVSFSITCAYTFRVRNTLCFYLKHCKNLVVVVSFFVQQQIFHIFVFSTTVFFAQEEILWSWEYQSIWNIGHYSFEQLLSFSLSLLFGSLNNMWPVLHRGLISVYSEYWQCHLFLKEKHFSLFVLEFHSPSLN